MSGVAKLQWSRCFQGELGYHGIEITIIMEHRQSLYRTKRLDDYCNCFSYSNTSLSKESTIWGTLNGDIVSTGSAKWKITDPT